jgi:DNA-binding response OmpR family regulator
MKAEIRAEIKPEIKAHPVILTIDDEPAITESLAYALKAGGFSPLAASTLTEANEILSARGDEVELIILDLSLPDGHGFEWLRALRAHSAQPVIILSSHDDEVEHIVGLELGADDYIDKPFSPREVVARVRAILRRAQVSASSTAHSGLEAPQPISLPVERLSIDRARYEASVKGAPLSLSQLEFELLAYLYEHPNKAHSRPELLREVWGGGVYVNDRTVDVHIKTLRKKLSEAGAPDLIETVRGVGYRLKGEP